MSLQDMGSGPPKANLWLTAAGFPTATTAKAATSPIKRLLGFDTIINHGFADIPGLPVVFENVFLPSQSTEIFPENCHTIKQPFALVTIDYYGSVGITAG
jgi:hypothetical protein